MREQDLLKVMKYVKENKQEIKKILKFLEEQDTAAQTDKQKDPDDKFSDEDTQNVIDSGSEAGADEDADNVMNEDEISGTEETSDGVKYPDVGDGTGVEGETLREEEDCDDDEEVIDEEEDCDDDEDEELLDEEGGTPSVGAATGAAQPVDGAAGTANDGVARFKAPIGKGKMQKRYDEGFVPLNGGAKSVKAMMESWNKRKKYDPNIGGF